MITTPVRRVLGDFGAEDVYVETENSVYKLTFRSGQVAVAAARVKAR
jgi:hypothetical protein